MGCSHRRRGRDKTLVCSCVIVFTPPTRQDKTVSSRLQLCSHCQRGLVKTGLRRDKTVLLAVWTQLENRQNCLVSSRRWCEQAITVTDGVSLMCHLKFLVVLLAFFCFLQCARHLIFCWLVIFWWAASSTAWTLDTYSTSLHYWLLQLIICLTR